MYFVSGGGGGGGGDDDDVMTMMIMMVSTTMMISFLRFTFRRTRGYSTVSISVIIDCMTE